MVAVSNEVQFRILIIEDDLGQVVTTTDLLAGEGYGVERERDGEAGLRRALHERFDLILLDVVLPRKTGFDVCRELRENGVDTPILMVTGRTEVMDRVVGLRLGADDYLVKPYDPAELLARVGSLLRRIHKQTRTPVVRYRFDDVEIDFEAKQARKSGELLPMTSKELQLLRYLVDHRETLVTREQIMGEVWEYSREVSSRTVDVHIAWLRQKLEPVPHEPRHILTVRGKGYRFAG